jgi:hypothetical protein
MKYSSGLASWLALALLMATRDCAAQSSRFTYQRIAGAGTPLPGDHRLLEVYSPSLDAGHVAFHGDQEHRDGEYAGLGIFSRHPNGTLELLADETTPVPGTLYPFWDFGVSQSIDGGRVVFNALSWPDELPEPIEGFYAFENGGITVVADTTTPIPSAPGNFTSLWEPNESPSADGGRIAFLGGGANDVWGLYIEDGGVLSRVVDTTTPVPNDTRSFTYFRSPVLDGDRLAFVADLDDGTQGVYLHDLAANNLSVVADNRTLIPGRSEYFESFPTLDLDGDTVAFVAESGSALNFGGFGVYGYDISAGAVTTIVANGTPVPGSPSDQFRPYFQSVSVDDGHVVFQYGAFVVTRVDEFLTPHYGIYTDLGGSLEKLIGFGDELDGMFVGALGRSGDLEISQEAIDGHQIAMFVRFEDDSTAIYIARLVPEPCTALLVAVAALMVLAPRGPRLGNNRVAVRAPLDGR